METQVKTPRRPLEPRILLWADAGYTDMCEIDKAQSTPDLESILCSVLHVEDVSEPMREVLLALYVHTVQFCRRSGFDLPQTSALLSIIKCMHKANIETSLDNTEQCFDYCSELLLCHSVKRPPFSVDLFKCHEVSLILEHVNNTYIRNYALYKYVFTPQLRLDLSLSYDGTPEEDDPPAEKPTSPDTEKELGETEPAAEPVDSQEPMENQENPQNPDPVEAAPGSRSALRQMIQKALAEEVLRVSDQLEQSLKESSEQLNRKLTSLQIQPQGNI